MRLKHKEKGERRQRCKNLHRPKKIYTNIFVGFVTNVRYARTLTIILITQSSRLACRQLDNVFVYFVSQSRHLINCRAEPPIWLHLCAWWWLGVEEGWHSLLQFIYVCSCDDDDNYDDDEVWMIHTHGYVCVGEGRDRILRTPTCNSPTTHK